MVDVGAARCGHGRRGPQFDAGVHAGNLPAKRLYEKLGYEVTGVRKRYYRDGKDGLIMTTPPLAGPAMQARLGAAHDDVLAKLKRCFDTRT